MIGQMVGGFLIYVAKTATESGNAPFWKNAAKVEKLSQKQDFDADSAPTKSTRKISAKTRFRQAENPYKTYGQSIFLQDAESNKGHK